MISGLKYLKKFLKEEMSWIGEAGHNLGGVILGRRLLAWSHLQVAVSRSITDRYEARWLRQLRVHRGLHGQKGTMALQRLFQGASTRRGDFADLVGDTST